MSATLAELAVHVQGTVRGDGTVSVTSGAALEAAGPQQLSFVQDGKQLSRLKDCRAAALVTTAALAEDPRLAGFPCLLVDHPSTVFVALIQVLQPPRTRPSRGIANTACIAGSAHIGADCYIGAGAVIGDDVVVGTGCDIYPGVVIGPGCRVGNDVTLYPHAVLYADIAVEDRAIIHAHAVLGADGFGYRFVAGRFEKIPQLGTVRIEADVEIGAGTTIDRGAIGATVIGAGSKIDNQVMIGHNCEIGRHNVLAGQVGMAGSCSTGDFVRIGGQVGVKDHVRLNTGASVGAKAAIHKDIPQGETWIGYPATPEFEQKRLQFAIHRLPQLRDQVKQLAAEMAALQREMETLRAGGNTPSDLRAA
jgi:UDP-3-O-[3-hydroxymyristoyl] glucosamine N-acyltransferase